MAKSDKMKRTNSFVLFGRAFKNAKNDFWVSIQVLFFITIGLAFIFWRVEGIAQPDVYGGISGLFQSFVWAFTRYIGDPGGSLQRLVLIVKTIKKGHKSDWMKLNAAEIFETL